MSVVDWLAERELFNKIFKLPLFAKFRFVLYNCVFKIVSIRALLAFDLSVESICLIAFRK